MYKATEEKGRIVKRNDFSPTLTRYYVDRELGIEIGCQVISIYEYENGIKEYKIKYIDKSTNNEIIRTVNEDKIEDVYLPSHSYHETDAYSLSPSEDDTDIFLQDIYFPSFSESAIYGVDIGGCRTVITYLNEKMIHKVLESELGEKYVSYMNDINDDIEVE